MLDDKEQFRVVEEMTCAQANGGNAVVVCGFWLVAVQGPGMEVREWETVARVGEDRPASSRRVMTHHLHTTMCRAA